MEEKKEDKKKYRSIKVSEDVWELVKAHKKETWKPIGIFFEEAATEKLQLIKNQQHNG